ncbi:MAG: BTAD domain-containing putative transcriptional regulator [Anaerolineae bacterium]
MDHLSLSLFGPLRISINQQEVLGISSFRGSVLLAYLTLEGATPQSRQKLANLFWPDAEPAAAKNSLRQTLYRLKSLFKPEGQFNQFFVANRQTIRFLPEASHWVDVKEYQQLLSARKGSNLGFEEQTRLIERMISLYQGEFLAGYELDSSAELDGWIQNRRVWFRDQTADALKVLIQSFQELGKLDMAQVYADKLLNIDPLNEYAFQKKLELLIEKGQSAEALNQYANFRSLLHQHISIEPNHIIQNLVRSIQIGHTRPQKQTAPVSFIQKNQSPKQQTDIPKTVLPALPQPHLPFSGNLLSSNLQPAAGSVLAIWGLPGVGKSVLANEIARRFSLQHYFDLRQQSPNDLNDYLDFASASLNPTDEVLVLDNVDRTPNLNSLLKKIADMVPRISLIITSRSAKKLTRPVVNQFKLTGLDQSNAMQLLLQKGNGTAEHRATAAAIIRKIGGHPSALLELTRWLQIFSWEMLAQKIEIGEFLWDETPLADWYSTLWESLSETEVAFLNRFGQAEGDIPAGELARLPLSYARAAMLFVERGLLHKQPDGSLNLQPLFKLWIQNLEENSLTSIPKAELYQLQQPAHSHSPQRLRLDQTEFIHEQPN